MQLEGRCYCGELRCAVEGEPVIKGQCHCRECQYVSGGGPNFIFGFREKGFGYTAGEPSSFSRSDLESAVTREFCAKCGTHILSRVPEIPGVVILKVGTLDDPKQFLRRGRIRFRLTKQVLLAHEQFIKNVWNCTRNGFGARKLPAESTPRPNILYS